MPELEKAHPDQGEPKEVPTGMEDVLAEMKRIGDAVVESKSDPATFDFEQVSEVFGDQIETLVDAQVKQRLDKAPLRKGQPIWAVGRDSDIVALRGNRYFAEMKDFATQGFHQFGTWKMTPTDLVLTDMILERAHREQPDRYGAPSDDLKNAIKAMGVGETGAGAELLMTDMVRSLWEDFFLASKVAALINTIPMPTSPYDAPLGLGDVTWRKGTENQPTTSQNLTTAKVTMTVTELLAEINWSYSLDEQAVVPMMPSVRAGISRSGAEMIDDFILNADATATATGNINSDDAAPDADANYLTEGQDGMRHQWLVDKSTQANDAGGDAYADADILNALADMDKYAVDPSRVASVCDVATYLKGYLGLTNVTTLDKFGPGAVIHTGQLASYRGVPIIVSASHRKAEADGKRSATESNNTLGSNTFFNRGLWWVGFLRNLMVEVDRDIRSRQFILVASMQEAVACHGTRSSAQHTAGVYNILV